MAASTRDARSGGLTTTLLVAVLFVLIGPGIHVVRADPVPDGPMSVGEPARLVSQPPAAPAEDAEPVAGPQACEVGTKADVRARTRAAARSLQEKLQAAMAAEGDDAPIVLNGRGYAYGNQRPDALAELQRIEQEAARAKH